MNVSQKFGKPLLLAVLVAALIVLIIALKAGPDNTTAVANQTQTYFQQFVVAGGPIVWFALLPLSIFTVYLFLWHALTIRQKRLSSFDSRQELAKVLDRGRPEEVAERVVNRDDLVSVAVRQALYGTRQRSDGRGDDKTGVQKSIAQSLHNQVLRLSHRLEWLQLIGNISPMIGLFGTVFGMIKLFNRIVTAGGQPRPVELADGISVALVTTFWGLSIAIPALAMHGIFKSRIEMMLGEALSQAVDIVAKMRKNLNYQKRTEKNEYQRAAAAARIRTMPVKPPEKLHKQLHLQQKNEV
ncbi:MAG: MotA/TolQ/ExbB proton channel family protein [Sedimentisphaerales bacterium]|nr:MotA/TolQ/ExbB proton channel family protein [Sedimentisphaerales bacterium]